LPGIPDLKPTSIMALQEMLDSPNPRLVPSSSGVAGASASVVRMATMPLLVGLLLGLYVLFASTAEARTPTNPALAQTTATVSTGATNATSQADASPFLRARHARRAARRHHRRRLRAFLGSAHVVATRTNAAPWRPRGGVGEGRPAEAPTMLIAPAPTTPSQNSEPAPGTILFQDRFEYPEGLITNEYSHWNPTSPEATLSPVWQMTSGSLFDQTGTAWTGIPDGCSTSSVNSTPCTASDVFRLNTAQRNFGDVTVSMDLRNNDLTSSSRTPPESWDGVHIWLHYQSEYKLYYASFNRRDGHIVIKKKCQGGTTNGGTYYELGQGEVSGYPIPFGVWQHVAATIQDNADGSVTIAMYRNGTELLSATDTGVGCAPITTAGSVGVRGDNDNFNFDNFTVTQN
jgi:hypothetical protein